MVIIQLNNKHPTINPLHHLEINSLTPNLVFHNHIMISINYLVKRTIYKNLEASTLD